MTALTVELGLSVAIHRTLQLAMKIQLSRILSLANTTLTRRRLLFRQTLENFPDPPVALLFFLAHSLYRFCLWMRLRGTATPWGPNRQYITSQIPATSRIGNRIQKVKTLRHIIPPVQPNPK